MPAVHPNRFDWDDADDQYYKMAEKKHPLIYAIIKDMPKGWHIWDEAPEDHGAVTFISPDGEDFYVGVWEWEQGWIYYECKAENIATVVDVETLLDAVDEFGIGEEEEEDLIFQPAGGKKWWQNEDTTQWTPGHSYYPI